MNRVTLRLYVIALATIAVVAIACERVPLTSPTGSTISLTVDQTTLPLNGQATVRAVVIESAGTPVHNGTQVVFVSPLGSFNPPAAETIGGVATSTFFAGSVSGTTRINAFSGGTSTGSGNSSGGGVEVKIGAAAAGSLTLTASPPSVSQSGGTVTVAATVFDANGNALPGINVNFSSTNGVLTPTSATTDSAGVARVQLATTSTATVTATAGSAPPREVTVTASAAPNVQIGDPNPASPAAGQPVAFTVTVTTGGTGNATPRQVQTLDVNFGDGTRETRSNVTGSAGFTHIYQNPGGYTITATATDVGNNTGVSSKSIVVGFPAQPTASISASPNPVSMSGTAQGVVILDVTAAPSSAPGAAPIRDVRVTAQDGSVIFQNSGPVNGADVPYRFSAPGTYTFRVTATDANGQTATNSTVVFVTP